jgi:hypothetical protein
MIYSLPIGSTTVVLYVKSKTKNFFPHLYMSVQNYIENKGAMIFPPDETIGFEEFYDWDQDMYQMKVSFDYHDQSEGSYLAMNLKYNLE